MKDKEIAALIQAGDAALLSTISTSDLVRELCSRLKDCDEFFVPDECVYRLTSNVNCACSDCTLTDIAGPARIIVVRGEWNGCGNK